MTQKAYCIPEDKKMKVCNLDEKKILNRLMNKTTGSLERNISSIINEAVFEQMHVDMDSTIMQVLVLNEYLSKIFKQNFKELMYNYIMNYLEIQQNNDLSMLDEESIEAFIDKITIKTTLEEMREEIEQLIQK